MAFYAQCALVTLASVGVFQAASWLYRKVKTPLLNPLLVSSSIIIIVLCISGISLGEYEKSSVSISFFLGPATVALAYSVYVEWELLKKNFIPILAGCFAGSLVSMVSAYSLCLAFGLNDHLARSFVAKSVTMPIAVSITSQLGGVVSITVAAVIISGIIGAVCSPFLIKLFNVTSSVALGVALGASSHAVGTTKAVEMGQLEGAMAGVAIAVSGILTTLIVVVARFFV